VTGLLARLGLMAAFDVRGVLARLLAGSRRRGRQHAEADYEYAQHRAEHRTAHDNPRTGAVDHRQNDGWRNSCPGAILTRMTREAERDYVRRWTETGRILEEIRWRELRALSASAALKASDDLIDLARRVPLPVARRAWSGLIELQDRLHGSRRT